MVRHKCANLVVRMSPGELEELKADARALGHENVSAYTRALIRTARKKIRPDDPDGVRREIVRELEIEST